MTTPWTVYLGGRDLEMRSIAAVLARREGVEVCDARPGWGAGASVYLDGLNAALAEGRHVALIELIDDLPPGVPRDRLHWVDHHGERAGTTRPTSLEQIFALLELPAALWTRDLELVAANDRGHVAGLLEAGATRAEIADVRGRDRAAQGITSAQEVEGRAAARGAVHHFAGRLTVVRLGHGRTATVTDALAAELGGPGYDNLIIMCPGQTAFFGEGRCVARLSAAWPGGWYGGDLPRRGYWGITAALPLAELFTVIRGLLVPSDHSKSITVAQFQLTLIWPVLLHGNPDDKVPRVDAWASWFAANAGWADPIAAYAPEECPPIPNEYGYEEIVYFHPFFRDFLMGDGGTPKRDLTTRFLTRDDVRQARVDLAATDKFPAVEITLDVGRVMLYVMKPCVALLCVEVSVENRSLWEVQKLQDEIRRIYPPFWYGKGSPGLCPQKVEWLGEGGAALAGTDFTAASSPYREFAQSGAEPPVAEHWRYFFGPLEPLETRKDITKGKLCYQQLTDERIPTMSYLAVPDPSRISQGDYDRLAFVDAPTDDANDAETYAYNQAFFDRLRSDYVYDRFSHYGTTYLCCGYGFTVVGQSGWFFENVVRGHFRHHYFRMGVVAHYQRAAILYFAEQLSDAIKTLAGKGPSEELRDPKFRKELEEVQMGFLKFRSRAYFPEVSNQLQARELWAFWFRHLNTQVLFEQVDATSQRMTDVLSEHENREIAREQQYLARIAKWGLGITIVFAVMAGVWAWAGLIENRDVYRVPGIGPASDPWTWFWASIVAAVVSGLAMWALFELIRLKTFVRQTNQ